MSTELLHILDQLAAFGAAFLGEASLAKAPMSALIISFTAYSFIGWLWESTVCGMLNQGRFVNSGFLLGPWCPIYGAGGLACWLLLRGIDGTGALFLCAMIVCTALEYCVGLLLEAFTGGTRFWDYSDMPFNFQGRVCLYGALMFGAASVFICKLAEPAILGFLNVFPTWMIVAAATALTVLFIADTAFAIAGWKRFSKKLELARAEIAEKLNESLQERSDNMLQRIPDEAIDSAHLAHVRGRAINGWISVFTSATMDALKEKTPDPVGALKEKLATPMEAIKAKAPARPAMPPKPSMPSMDALREKAPSLEDIRKVIPSVDVLLEKISLTRTRFTWGERRFFTAFPMQKLNSTDSFIKTRALTQKAKEILHRN